MRDSRYWLRFIPGILLILFVGKELLLMDFTSDESSFVVPVTVSNQELIGIGELGISREKKVLKLEEVIAEPEETAIEPEKVSTVLDNFLLRGITISGEKKIAYFFNQQNSKLDQFEIGSSVDGDSIIDITENSVHFTQAGWVKLYVYRSDSNTVSQLPDKTISLPETANKETKPKITDTDEVRIYQFQALDSDSLYK